MKRPLLALLVIVLYCNTSASPVFKKLNNRPIIAVLAQKYPRDSNQSYIAASYVKYLESAGARVVPIPHYFKTSTIKNIFENVNGVLYPGGSVDWFTSDFYKNSKLLWDLAIEANDKGDYFPVWGTCLGFEMMQLLRMGKNVLSRRVSDDVASKLMFTNEAKNSRLFKAMAPELYKALATEELTYNHHDWGVTPETYKENARLSEFFKVLSTNLDEKGQEYISTIEARKYPIYGVQWHPEKNNFEFPTFLKGIPHSADAVRVSQYMANFLVNEARQNFRKFPTKAAENEYLIYKYKPVHSAVDWKMGALVAFEQVYLFTGSSDKWSEEGSNEIEPLLMARA